MILLMIGISGNCLGSANIISNVGFVVMRKKTSKSDKTKIFAQSCQRRWIFFLDLELFFILKLLSELYHWVEKTEKLCLFIHVYSLDYSPLDQYYSRKLVLIVCIPKRTCYFSFFLSLMLGKQESTFSGSLWFTASICKILKNRKTISLVKVALTKKFSLINLLCCEKDY